LSIAWAEPPRAAAIDSPAKPTSLTNDDFERWTERLNKRISVDFRNTPFPQVVDALRAKTGANIVLEPKVVTFKDFNVDIERERQNDPKMVLVTFAASDVRFEAVLELIFQPLDLWYYEVGDLLVLGPRREVQYFLQRVYPVADLVVTSSDKGVFNSSADLVESISTQLERDVWQRGGGDATISRFGPLESLLVFAPASAHRKVEQYLSKLRQSRVQTQELLKASGLPPLQEVIRRQLPVPEAALPRIETPPSAAPPSQPAVSVQDFNNARQAAESALRMSLRLEQEVAELRQKIESLASQKK
jgi:hypothetical protein